MPNFASISTNVNVLEMLKGEGYSEKYYLSRKVSWTIKPVLSNVETEPCEQNLGYFEEM